MIFIAPYSCTMKNSALNTWLIEIISALLILLFVYTGISKLHEQDTFRIVLSKSPLIESHAHIFAWLLPLTELSTGLLLLFPFTRKLGIVIALILMCLFTGYIAYMILFTSKLPCSCGGVLQQMTWKQHLLFNICFTVLAAAGLRLYKKNKFLLQ